MCFIPMQLGEPNPASLQPDPCDAFHFPPTASAIQPPEPRQFTNPAPGGDCFDFGEVAYELEIHSGAILAISDRATPLDHRQSIFRAPVGPEVDLPTMKT